jgi:putative transposase
MAEKKVKGRKRHIVTDIEGNILAVRVHAANTHDTKGGCAVFARAFWKYPSLKGVCGDEGYRGTFFDFVKSLKLNCDISERIKPKFEILPKRWRVERTFAWLNNYRGLSKDYEITVTSAETNIMIAHTHTLLRRCFPTRVKNL